MLRRTLRYVALTLLLSGIVFLYLIYFAQNGLSLSLNLGTSLPDKLTVMEMNGRRTVRPIDIFDETFSARCRTTKESLRNWLLTADLEVIYYRKDTTAELKFVRDFDSLPNEILNNEIGYGIQMPKKIADSPQIEVTPSGKDSVFMNVNFDWN